MFNGVDSSRLVFEERVCLDVELLRPERKRKEMEINLPMNRAKCLIKCRKT